MFDYIWGLMNAAWFSLLVGTALGIAGIIIGLVLHKRGKQVARLGYLMSEFEVISPQLTALSEGLTVSFEGKTVPRITKAAVGIWNAGTTTIRGSDVVSNDPIRLNLAGEGSILRAQIVTASRPVIEVLVTHAGEKRVELTFDYMDPEDGCRCEIIHSGGRDSLSISGTIRGIPQGITKHEHGRAAERTFLAFLFTMVGLAGLAVLGFIAALGYWILKIAPWPVNLIVGCASVALVAVMVWDGRKSSAEIVPAPQRLKGVPDFVTDDQTLAATVAFLS